MESNEPFCRSRYGGQRICAAGHHSFAPPTDLHRSRGRFRLFQTRLALLRTGAGVESRRRARGQREGGDLRALPRQGALLLLPAGAQGTPLPPLHLQQEGADPLLRRPHPCHHSQDSHSGNSETPFISC
ncbi:hypothetical protein AVEN_140961-1 [Araneus ventricosus]|uniref:Uncharacterized protein n=1 Tax=Araneus ventricosus TaxID=182803 RepID=A0A4Y2WS81_ARAVE|nr:hypothetical protein AVEN_140961-1 [Araneus ventricosus]